jgi:hypothetical protein
MKTKTMYGGARKWDFVNGYFGEKREDKATFETILARTTDAGKAVKRSGGCECLKVE